MSLSWMLLFLVSLSASKALPATIVDPSIVTASPVRREASSVGILSNLPTIGTATDCMEVLPNGRELFHTNTGGGCTYNTVTPPAPTTTKIKPSSVQSEFGNGGLGTHPTGEATNKCGIHRQQIPDANGKTRWVRIDREASMRDCNSVCKADAGKPKSNFPNAACIMFGDPVWETETGYPGNLQTQIALGNCSCNNPILAKIAEEFVTHALPAIAEVTCKVWYTAIQTVATIGIEEIPGVGAAVGVAVNVAYQAAQVALWTYDTEEGAANAFKAWLENPVGAASNSSTWGMDKVCGNKYTPQEGQDVFSAFSMASGFLGPGLWTGAARSFPPPWPKGKGSMDDMLGYLGDLGVGKKKPDGSKPAGDKPDVTKPNDDRPKATPTAKPTDKATTKPSPTATRKSTSESPTSACTRNGKRAPGKDKDDDCDKPTVTIVKASITAKQQNVETKTCDFQSHTQACAHYYSVIHTDGKSRFTCEDSNTRVEGEYTDQWFEQHNTARGWEDWTSNDYTFKADTNNAEPGKKLDCEADEWPPAYFIPEGKKHETEWGQKIRWIPAGENGGAASLWRGFCTKNDGGENNGQRTAPRKQDRNGKWIESDEEYWKNELNPKLVENVQGLKPDHVDRSGKTVTETYNKVTYTRGVFEIAFKNPKPEGVPSEKNNWYLDENPCWPKDIVPNDPGFVLLTNDPWYTKHNPKLLEGVGVYAHDPPKEMVDAAKERRGKRPAPDGGSPAPNDDGSPPPKAQKPNDPPSGSQRLHRRERLEMIKNRIVLRDDAFNITRPLTNEEISRNVEITNCADRFCSSERAAHGDDGSIYVPGAAPQPSANTAVPTLVSRVAVPQAHVKRTPLSAEIPVITAVAKLES